MAILRLCERPVLPEPALCLKSEIAGKSSSTLKRRKSLNSRNEKSALRRFILNWWVVQDSLGLALRVMLSHQPESLPAIQSNLQQVLILHGKVRAPETKKAP